MRTIDIKTTQNVVITYELAAARDRIVAFIIDTLIKAAALALLGWIYEALPYSVREETEVFFVAFFVIPIAMLSLLLQEYFMQGQTIGKKLMRLRVVKLNGRQPQFYDYLLRWCFRLVDVYGTLGVSGSIMVAGTTYAQRLGDMVSNTTVVRVNNRLSIRLEDILRIDDRQSYEPVYPLVRNFREEDILAVKNAVNRYTRYRNEAHRNALAEVSERLAQQLGLNEPPSDTMRFLRTVIKDYIVLTR